MKTAVGAPEPFEDPSSRYQNPRYSGKKQGYGVPDRGNSGRTLFPKTARTPQPKPFAENVRSQKQQEKKPYKK